MKIGKIQIDSPTALAPMEAVNCKAFRMLCKEHGAGLIYTARVDVDDILEGRAKDYFFDIDKTESPLSFQISGNNPEKLVKAAKIIEPYTDIIDINLGCIEGDILGKKSGAYFIKHPELIERTFLSLINAVKCPITAKIRIGWDTINALEVSKILEKIGVKAIAIHGRTRIQKYTGKSDWETIKNVKQQISIPVIGNGDIQKPGQAKFYLERGYCDMVMIGRYAKRNPAIFSQINDAINNLNVKTVDKNRIISRFKELYKKQKRKSESELLDHLNWLS